MTTQFIIDQSGAKTAVILPLEGGAAPVSRV
jgi:hypothetical protein